MLSVSSQTRVYLARDPVDMRKSFNGLIGLTESVFKQDPLSGHLFVFLVHPAEAYVADQNAGKRLPEPPLGLDKRGPPLPPSPSHRPQRTRGEGRCDGEGGRG